MPAAWPASQPANNRRSQNTAGLREAGKAPYTNTYIHEQKICRHNSSLAASIYHRKVEPDRLKIDKQTERKKARLPLSR